MRLFLLPLMLLVAVAGCDTSGNSSTATIPTTAKPAGKNAERDAWQLPDTLFSVMNGVRGQTVADLFADDGYMTFKLIDAGANVIAMETDQAKVDQLIERKKELGLGDDRLRVRKVEAGDPGLAPEEADVALLMHHFTRQPAVMRYIDRVRQGLKAPKRVVIVDFLPRPSPMGPPVYERLNETQVMDSMDVLMIGDVGAYTMKLPYQYIVIAQDRTLSDEELQMMDKGALPVDHR